MGRVGHGGDFAGSDVADKAVIIQTIGRPARWATRLPGRERPNGPRTAEPPLGPWRKLPCHVPSASPHRKRAALGAVGNFISITVLIIGVWGYAGNMAIWQRLSSFRMLRNPDGTPRYSRPQVGTPGFFMGFEDGRRLRDMVAPGETVRITATLDTEIREGLRSPNVFGALPGTTDETIYVTAHIDGYYNAALDNASGMAVMIGLADYFAAMPREERRRTITFTGTAGHHVGSSNAPYVRDHGMLAREGGPDGQLRARRADVVRSVQQRASPHQHRVAPPLVGPRQSGTARPHARRVRHVRRDRHRHDGAPPPR